MSKAGPGLFPLAAPSMAGGEGEGEGEPPISAQRPFLAADAAAPAPPLGPPDTSRVIVHFDVDAFYAQARP